MLTQAKTSHSYFKMTEREMLQIAYPFNILEKVGGIPKSFATVQPRYYLQTGLFSLWRQSLE